MEKQAIYCGIFFNSDSVKKLTDNQLIKHERIIANMHCTFVFRPSQEHYKAFYDAIGREYNITVIGYGYDAKNSGFSVIIPHELKNLYNGAEIPHITVSVSENGKPVDTGKLSFVPVVPFTIKGTIGVFYNTGLEMEKTI